MLKILFITFFMTIISGCVTNAEILQDQLAEDSQGKLICKSEKEIDSEMQVEKCLTQAELDKLEENHAQANMQALAYRYLGIPSSYFYTPH